MPPSYPLAAVAKPHGFTDNPWRGPHQQFLSMRQPPSGPGDLHGRRARSLRQPQAECRASIREPNARGGHAKEFVESLNRLREPNALIPTLRRARCRVRQRARRQPAPVGPRRRRSELSTPLTRRARQPPASTTQRPTIPATHLAGLGAQARRPAAGQHTAVDTRSGASRTILTPGGSLPSGR